MISIHTKKGYNLKIEGKPTRELEKLTTPSHVALIPEHIPFIRPRLKVKRNDRVKVGTPLIEDKRLTDIRFLSPGGGRVVAINFGPRRVIKEIVIQLDKEEDYLQFEAFSEQDIDAMARQELIDAVIKGGLWPLIRSLPFRDYPQPDSRPPAIFLSLGNLEPFQADPRVYLQGNIELFMYGLRILQKLADGRLYVGTHKDNTFVLEKLDGHITHTYSGNFPAHDPGVWLYHTRAASDENRSWYLSGQDVLLLARLLKTGIYPTERIVVLAGSSVTQRMHFKTRLGVPLKLMATDRIKPQEKRDIRYCVGGVHTGYAQPSSSYLGLLETSVTVLPEGNEKGEFLGFIRPGFRKPSYSRTFMSHLNRSDLEMDCNKHGGDRACIACYHCAQVCPVDILVHFTFKAILAGEVEESIEHGLLDCVECGLCSYVCPSKLELFATLKKAKAEFYREQTRQL
jgi:Na+-transporting NADH:ubiquinone oxidoreductase subunit A